MPTKKRQREKLAAMLIAGRNAWTVLMLRGWTVHRDRHGDWFPMLADGSGYPMELLGWKHKPFRDPVEAVLAADLWVEERENEVGSNGRSRH